MDSVSPMTFVEDPPLGSNLICSAIDLAGRRRRLRAGRFSAEMRQICRSVSAHEAPSPTVIARHSGCVSGVPDTGRLSYLSVSRSDWGFLTQPLLPERTPLNEGLAEPSVERQSEPASLLIPIQRRELVQLGGAQGRRL